MVKRKSTKGMSVLPWLLGRHCGTTPYFSYVKELYHGALEEGKSKV
jgi:hypothetical protein